MTRRIDSSRVCVASSSLHTPKCTLLLLHSYYVAQVKKPLETEKPGKEEKQNELRSQNRNGANRKYELRETAAQCLPVITQHHIIKPGVYFFMHLLEYHTRYGIYGDYQKTYLFSLYFVIQYQIKITVIHEDPRSRVAGMWMLTYWVTLSLKIVRKRREKKSPGAKSPIQIQDFTVGLTCHNSHRPI